MNDIRRKLCEYLGKTNYLQPRTHISTRNKCIRLRRSLFQPSKYISDCLPAPEHVVTQPACVKSSSLPSEQSTAPSHLLAKLMQLTTPVTHP